MNTLYMDAIEEELEELYRKKAQIEEHLYLTKRWYEESETEEDRCFYLGMHNDLKYYLIYVCGLISELKHNPEYIV